MRVESNARNKPHLAFQSGLVRDKLQENIARFTWFLNFCTRNCIKDLAENFLKARLAYFCLENVVRGNAVQICSDFPAKRLSIFLKNFSWQIKHYWTKQKCWLLYCVVIIVRARNKRQVEKYFFILLFVLLFLIVVVKVNKLLFF